MRWRGRDRRLLPGGRGAPLVPAGVCLVTSTVSGRVLLAVSPPWSGARCPKASVVLSGFLRRPAPDTRTHRHAHSLSVGALRLLPRSGRKPPAASTRGGQCSDMATGRDLLMMGAREGQRHRRFASCSQVGTAGLNPGPPLHTPRVHLTMRTTSQPCLWLCASTPGRPPPTRSSVSTSPETAPRSGTGVGGT